MDTSFVAPDLLGDPIWTPFAAQSVAAAPNVSASAIPEELSTHLDSFKQIVDPSSSTTSSASQDDLSWLFEAGQFTPAISSPTGGSNEGGPITPEYGALSYGVTT